MHTPIDLSPFHYDGSRTFSIKGSPTLLPAVYSDKKDYKDLLEEYQKEIDELQNMMYAHDRYGMLLIFQAMDAAGKDGTIRHVMSGINPHGVEVHAFKKPSELELDHDFMWRTTCKLPPRGRIGIFNRSYYEEVLVVRVHPVIIQQYQRIPPELIQDLDAVWQQRYEDIRNLELYCYRNGIRVVKFFLNISKDEQRRRFISRIDRPSKNWKFAEGDVKERGHWDAYMQAYEDAINATAAPHAPWYVIPGDDKKNMRLMVSEAILQHLRQLDMHYPRVDDARRAELQRFKHMLENEEVSTTN
ncbi:MAG: polyphosphate kinase 2 family protein [Bacteroidetes bacterium]|nr:MAG: polyphosphate kinase 2 family protein [Bacteroidota bacterium]